MRTFLADLATTICGAKTTKYVPVHTIRGVKYKLSPLGAKCVISYTGTDGKNYTYISAQHDNCVVAYQKSLRAINALPN